MGQPLRIRTAMISALSTITATKIQATSWPKWSSSKSITRAMTSFKATRTSFRTWSKTTAHLECIVQKGASKIAQPSRHLAWGIEEGSILSRWPSSSKRANEWKKCRGSRRRSWGQPCLTAGLSSCTLKGANACSRASKANLCSVWRTSSSVLRLSIHLRPHSTEKTTSSRRSSIATSRVPTSCRTTWTTGRSRRERFYEWQTFPCTIQCEPFSISIS